MRFARTPLASAARRWAAVLALTTVAACGGAGASSSPAGPTGHLHIVATVSPTCPVQHAGSPPCVAPYAGPLDITRPDGSVLSVTTSAAGTADLDLPPGTYRITLANNNSGVGGLRQPVSVTVVAGATADASVAIDSGIR